MKHRLLAFGMTFGLSLALAAPARAASPFDGTWKADIKNAELPKKPDVTLLKDGVYTCSSCLPVFTVKADGAFHPLTGFPYFDEAAVTVVDANTVSEVDKLKGKVVVTQQSVVAPDGRAMKVSWVDASAPDGRPVTGEIVQERAGPAPAGSHAVSGMWRTVSIAGISDSAVTMTVTTAGDGFAMKTPNGYSYDAMLGGPPVPFVGDTANTMIALRSIDARTVEETDTRDGKVVSVSTMKVLPDGRTMSVVSENRRQGTTTRYSMFRQ